MNMIVGRTIVISTEDNSVVLSEATITSGIPKDVRDYSKQNAEAVSKRRDRFAGSQPRPGRRRASNDAAFEALRMELRQITDLLSLIDQGNVDHVPGILARLRMTIAEGDPMPLLQMCAAMVNRPLVVYVPPITTSTKPLRSANLESIVYAISSIPTQLTKNAADLDVWLDSRAAQLKEQVLSQRKLLEHLGNTIGAHYAIDVHPMADLLRSWKSGIDGVDLDFLIRYVCSVAHVISELIPQILAVETI
jgi:hypothetical protein